MFSTFFIYVNGNHLLHYLEPPLRRRNSKFLIQREQIKINKKFIKHQNAVRLQNSSNIPINTFIKLFINNNCEPLHTLSSLLSKSTRTLTKEVLKINLINCIKTKVTIKL
jgi:hypothetical protein